MAMANHPLPMCNITATLNVKLCHTFTILNFYFTHYININYIYCIYV